MVRAHDLWQVGGSLSLEIELRILARQNDNEIALEMDIPAASIQAFRDIFFDIDDRIDGTSYVMHQVMGIHPLHPPTPIQLAKACAYQHGPAIVASLMDALTREDDTPDLTSAAGRSMAALDLLLRVHSLPDNKKMRGSLIKRMPFLVKTRSNFGKSVSASAAFRKSTIEMMGQLGLPHANLVPISYSPKPKPTRPGRKHRQFGKAAQTTSRNSDFWLACLPPK